CVCSRGFHCPLGRTQNEWLLPAGSESAGRDVNWSSHGNNTETAAMNSKHSFRNMMIRAVRELAAVICIGALVPGSAVAAGTQQAAAPTEQAAAKLPPEQLDSLVAPIALYPDPLLSQVLVASTYPLEVIQLQQWLAQNKGMN